MGERIRETVVEVTTAATEVAVTVVSAAEGDATVDAAVDPATALAAAPRKNPKNMTVRTDVFHIPINRLRVVNSVRMIPRGILLVACGFGIRLAGCVSASRAMMAKSTLGITAIFAVITDINRNFVLKLVKLMQRTERPFGLVSHQRRLLRSTSMP